MNVNLSTGLMRGLKNCISETSTDAEFDAREDLHSVARNITPLLRGKSNESVISEDLTIIPPVKGSDIWTMDMSPATLTVSLRSLSHIQDLFERNQFTVGEFPIRLLINREEFQILLHLLNEHLRYLPIGSVLVLKGGEKKLMISGRHQRDSANNQVFDYAAVAYPEGNVGPQATFLFNFDAIDEVIYFGYTDDEETAWVEKLCDSGTQLLLMSQDSSDA